MIAANATAYASEINAALNGFAQPEIGDAGVSVWSDTPLRLSVNGTSLKLKLAGTAIQARNFTSDWASAASTLSVVVKSGFLYALINDASNNLRIYRFSSTAISSGGTLMTISGAALGTTWAGGNVRMIADSLGNFYITDQGGNSASLHIVSKYSVSGTTATFVSNTTCGSTSSNFAGGILYVDGSGNIYAWSTADSKIRKYNSSGTLQTTGDAAEGDGNIGTYYLFLLETTYVNLFLPGTLGSGDSKWYGKVTLP